MQSLFEEPIPEPTIDQGSDNMDAVSPNCDSATDKVSVHLCCVCKCL